MTLPLSSLCSWMTAGPFTAWSITHWSSSWRWTRSCLTTAHNSSEPRRTSELSRKHSRGFTWDEFMRDENTDASACREKAKLKEREEAWMKIESLARSNPQVSLSRTAGEQESPESHSKENLLTSVCFILVLPSLLMTLCNAHVSVSVCVFATFFSTSTLCVLIRLD